MVQKKEFKAFTDTGLRNFQDQNEKITTILVETSAYKTENTSLEFNMKFFEKYILKTIKNYIYTLDHPTVVSSSYQ